MRTRTCPDPESTDTDTPINIDKATRHITLAYFDQKSTVDYIGAIQGIPVCFDAKECHTDTFPLANIHPHQVQFMEDFEKQGGISFLLISFTHKDESIICVIKSSWNSGIAWRQADEKVFAMRN